MAATIKHAPCYYIRRDTLSITDAQLNALVDDCSADDVLLKAITKKISSDIDLKRGDLISIIESDENERYRNNGVYIFGGEVLEELYSKIDDYGSIPPSYTYPEFPLDYFLPEIQHNSIVWLSEEVRQAALEGEFTSGPLDDSHADLPEGSPAVKVVFRYHGKEHHLYFSPEVSRGVEVDYQKYETILRRGLRDCKSFDMSLYQFKCGVSESDRYNLYVSWYIEEWTTPEEKEYFRELCH